MTTPSSILAQRIPWTEEPGRIQSMGSQESDVTYRRNHHNGSSLGGATVKEPACQCRRCKRSRLKPWVGRIPWRGHGNPLGCSYPENPTDRGGWKATAHGVAKSWTRLKRFNMHMRNLWVWTYGELGRVKHSDRAWNLHVLHISFIWMFIHIFYHILLW